MTFDDLPEATLDVTWSGAVAPMATIMFVVSQSNFADGVDVSAAYIVDHNVAPVMSTSYGSCQQSMGTGGTRSTTPCGSRPQPRASLPLFPPATTAAPMTRRCGPLCN